MIEEQYVSLEVAKLLKEKGFDEPCFKFYSSQGELGDWKYYPRRNKESFLVHKCSAPSQALAMRWLREVHHIHICPEYKGFFQERPKKVYHHWCNKIIGIGRYFKQGIQDLDKLDSDYFYFRSCKTYHDTYEDACEECIKFCLENLIEEGGRE